MLFKTIFSPEAYIYKLDQDAFSIFLVEIRHSELLESRSGTGFFSMLDPVRIK
jgi:hypothetical protein